MFKNKVLMITGGTGSFGHVVLIVFYQLMYAKFVFLAEMKKNKKICASDLITIS